MRPADAWDEFSRPTKFRRIRTTSRQRSTAAGSSQERNPRGTREPNWDETRDPNGRRRGGERGERVIDVFGEGFFGANSYREKFERTKASTGSMDLRIG